MIVTQLINSIVKTVYADDVVGTIAVPSGIPSEVGQTGNFISIIIRAFIIIAGLFTLWQFLSGGFTYISAGGEKAKISEATNRLTMSIVGLVVIAASFIVIAIVSQLLFGSFTAILSPKFQSVQ
ncbi:MAG TPA: hypothetical protein PLI45_03370 [Candidatus Woesebacteria bacterium]|nr:hypothetical protein [Candidatus Woesebacteria bacterium]